MSGVGSWMLCRRDGEPGPVTAELEPVAIEIYAVKRVTLSQGGDA